MKRIVYVSLFFLLTLLFTACGSSNSSDNTNNPKRLVAYFADNVNDAINVIDVDKMELLDNIPTGHQDTHTAGIASYSPDETKLYVSNRASQALDVIDTKSNEIIKTIALDFCPRSISVEKDTHLVDVAAVDRPMAAIIDAKSDELIATVGDKNTVLTSKCGHSYWLDATHFTFIDREHDKIYNYELKKENGSWKTTPIDALDTPSPVHHIAAPSDGNGTVFYAMAEGNSSVYPAVLKLTYSASKHLDINESLSLTYNNLSAADMGGHHLNFIKGSTKIYAGSKEGHLFVIDYSKNPMEIVKVLDAGIGAGHTVQSPQGDRAVVINHKDKFITLIDTKNDTKIADIVVSQLDDSIVGKKQIQAHTQYHFSPDGRYFYMALTEEGELIKVDLDAKKVVNRVHVYSGHLTMGSFVSLSK